MAAMTYPYWKLSFVITHQRVWLSEATLSVFSLARLKLCLMSLHIINIFRTHSSLQCCEPRPAGYDSAPEDPTRSARLRRRESEMPKHACVDMWEVHKSFFRRWSVSVFFAISSSFRHLLELFIRQAYWFLFRRHSQSSQQERNICSWEQDIGEN